MIAFPFFVSSVAYKIIEYSNRYFIDYFHGKELVGVFTLLSGIANVVTVLVFTAVIMVAYPELYKSYISNNNKIYKEMVRKFTRNVTGVSIGAGVLAVFFIHPLLLLIGKFDVYQYHFVTYYLLIVANIILNLSLIPHYILYVKKRDITIMTITLLGVILNIVLNYFLIQHYVITGAAISMIICFLIILFLKIFADKRIPVIVDNNE